MPRVDICKSEAGRVESREEHSDEGCKVNVMDVEPIDPF